MKAEKQFVPAIETFTLSLNNNEAERLRFAAYYTLKSASGEIYGMPSFAGTGTTTGRALHELLTALDAGGVGNWGYAAPSFGDSTPTSAVEDTDESDDEDEDESGC